MITSRTHSGNRLDRDKAWFESWFDSPYYEEIYDHRDLSEAKEFILRLTTTLALPTTTQILDLGCGWGRHTRSFAELGYTTTGLDLSPRLIAKAQENFIRPNDSISQRMNFCIGDMRDFQLNRDFDVVVNLFTSFGYFEDSDQDLKVLRNAHCHLKEDGFLVLDYFNTDAVLAKLNESEFRCGPKFDTKIRRTLEDGYIIKTIEIIHKNLNQLNEIYVEKVRCYGTDELHAMLNLSGFDVIHHWGNYHLDPAVQSSPRCIFAARKSTSSTPRLL